MSQLDYNNMLVAELKQELENFGLPTSGKKSELIERLMSHSKEPVMISIEADLIEDDSRYEAIFAKMKTQIIGPLNLGAVIAIGHFLLMISSVLVLKPAWLGFGEDYDYQLIDFDQSQTKIYAEELVALGHPDWEGRMSGTVEEANTSLYILDRLSEMGYEAQSYSYEVPNASCKFRTKF